GADRPDAVGRQANHGRERKELRLPPVGWAPGPAITDHGAVAVIVIEWKRDEPVWRDAQRGARLQSQATEILARDIGLQRQVDVADVQVQVRHAAGQIHVPQTRLPCRLAIGYRQGDVLRAYIGDAMA